MNNRLNEWLGIYVLVLCFSAPLAYANTSLNRENVDVTRPHLSIKLVYNYEVYKKPIFFKPKAIPSFVIWLKESSTNHIESIFVTKKAGKNKWTFSSGRPESIPVWYGIKKSEEENGGIDVDAITAATPRGNGITIYWQIPDHYLNKSVDLYLEANNSFDFNEHYHKKKNTTGYSGGNGQPSLIWHTSLTLSEQSTINLIPKIVGHGDVFGEHHNIIPDLSKITTAANTFKEISINYFTNGTSPE